MHFVLVRFLIHIYVRIGRKADDLNCYAKKSVDLGRQKLRLQELFFQSNLPATTMSVSVARVTSSIFPISRPEKLKAPTKPD